MVDFELKYMYAIKLETLYTLKLICRACFKYTYEDSMELLATLPALIGLVAKSEGFYSVKEETGDWGQFLSECLSKAFDISEIHTKSLADFLRLYIILNA